MSLLRAYASTASTLSDRSRAISCVSGGIAVGTMIGPAFQLFFTPLGEDGIDILSFYNLNIYNAPALFSLVLSILGYIIVKFKFEEEYRVLHETTGKVSGILSSPDYLAVGVCILTRFTQIFVQTTIETIGSAYSMMMFSFNKEEAVIYNSLVHVVAGTIGAILYLLFIVFDFTKYIRPRFSTILALFSFIALFLSTYSWTFLPKEVELLVNGSDTGCDGNRFNWCYGLTEVSPWVYYSCYVIVFGFSFSIMNIALSTLFSKIVGPRRQGTIQGVFQMAGSGGRMVAPIIISELYTLWGPRIAWVFDLVEVSATIFLWILFFRKMVSFKR